MAEVKTYTSIWKGLKIGARIAFQDGVYRTDDEDLQALIERNPNFGAQIRYEVDPGIDQAKVDMEARAKKKAELEAFHRGKAAQKVKDDEAAKQALASAAKKAQEAADKKKADDEAKAKADADLKSADAKKEEDAKLKQAGGKK